MIVMLLREYIRSKVIREESGMKDVITEHRKQKFR